MIVRCWPIKEPEGQTKEPVPLRPFWEILLPDYPDASRLYDALRGALRRLPEATGPISDNERAADGQIEADRANWCAADWRRATI